MNAPEAIAARLIGSLFVERGLVSEGQLRVALELQRETGAQLGQILVEQFGVSRKELARVVADQWREMQGGDSGAGPDAAPGQTWRPLGEIFITRGFVSEEELDDALRRQRKTGERLGEALVALGVISKFELAGALGEQMETLREAEEAEMSEAAPVVQLHEHLAEAASSYGVIDESAPTAEPYTYPDAAGDTELVPAVEPLVAEETDVAAVGEPEPELTEQPEPISTVADEVEPVAVEASADDAFIEPVAVEETAADTFIEPVAVEETAADTSFEPVVEDIDVDEPELVAALFEEATVAASSAEAGQTVGDWAGLIAQPALDTAVCLAYASTPKGYRLVALPVELPPVGARIDVPDVGEVVVLRIGVSPLPQDRRVCVYVEQPLAVTTALLPA